MALKLFIDSSAFIALADSNDQDHKSATHFLKECPPEIQFHTSSYIIAETMTRLRKTASHHVALRWGKALLESRQTTRHYPDASLEDEALKVFEHYHDHLLSFVDCTTIVFLKHLNIDKVFTFDNDFLHVGYTIVPGF